MNKLKRWFDAFGRFLDSKTLQLIAYLIIVGLVLFVFQSDQQDDRERCEAAASSREALRDTIEAFATLALVVIEPAPGIKPEKLTPQEELQLNAYRQRVEHFRSETLAKVKGNPACGEYEKEIDLTGTNLLLP